ncbi:TPA: TraB/GumN family protein [Salmonella enterica subsp. enterica serovar Gallinarum]|nr:polysaccharide biosynthesis protein GumN [Salmonella enterica subsp. enterica serovar Hadar]ELU9673972.1 TraB/GumN family protein [Salmonella enterica]
MKLLNQLKRLWRALHGTPNSWPAIDLSLPGGRHLHLVGSIHMGTRDMAPLPAKLVKKLRQADALVVEADISGNETPFSNLPKCPPLVERLSAGQLSALEKRVSELGMPLIHFDNQPLWQIAMVLQATQAQRLGLRPDYGIDYQLLQAAREMSLPVQELEGAKHQLELLCDLPDGGMALLDDTLTHWHTNARLLQVMIGWWLEQPPTSVGASLPRTFSQPLYDVLMVKRNEAWRDALLALPPGRYVVAVGALHLYGEGNLPQILK